MSTVGYRSAAAHLEDELARADLLLRSAVALHVAGLAGDTDSLRWGLSEVTPGEVATYLSAPPPPARPDFDDDPRAAGFRAKAATRRCEIDNRLAARDRQSTRLNSSHYCASRMPYSAWKKKQ